MTGKGQTSTKESLFAVATARPQGKAPNLIVLVHGCCTNAEKVSEWHTLRNTTIIDRLKNRYGKDWKKHWEIVVWDWHESTPPPPGVIDNVLLKTYADIAYGAAENEGLFLANAIMKHTQHTYDYIHMIGHSAGAKLIDEAAGEFAFRYAFAKNRPRFVHLTFLDAYTPSEGDKALYGFYSDYAEHYVDRSLGSAFAPTDVCLSHAFNFDISRWSHSPTESWTLGHHWPIHWYQNSVTSTSPKFKYGYTLSLEGSNDRFDELATLHPPGKQCGLDTGLFNENPNPDCQPATCW